jgi:hypothetical protein
MAIFVICRSVRGRKVASGEGGHDGRLRLPQVRLGKPRAPWKTWARFLKNGLKRNSKFELSWVVQLL